MDEMKQYLREHAQGDLLTWEWQEEAARVFRSTVRDIELISLSSGILPVRYRRNRRTISTADQLMLFQSVVSVVGCGGLGGCVVEELARLGVGTIRVIDPDVFAEHNLNRQVFCTFATLGKAKTDAARDRVATINPAVEVIPIQESLNGSNGGDFLAGSSVVVDGLDSITARLELADICTEQNIALVHGGIAGWYGQVAIQPPGERTIRKIFSSATEGQGIEKELGIPSFTPAVVAGLEVAETCKIILKTGKILAGRMLFLNLFDMEVLEIHL